MDQHFSIFPSAIVGSVDELTTLQSESNAASCTYTYQYYYYYYYGYDLCDGSYCISDRDCLNYNCESNKCTYTYVPTYSSNNLTWLWCTLSAAFLVIIVVLIIVWMRHVRKRRLLLHHLH